ncbi:BON domain-containing protein [Deinococcus sp. UYEF24]
MKHDQQLQEQVMAELRFSQAVNPAQIGVTVTDNVVTLTGTVETFMQKLAAVQAAERVSGVHGVADEIEIDLGAAHQRTDSEIALAALEALTWSWIVALQAVKVRVDHGWLTLEGDLAWDYQRQAAQDAVTGLIGVRGIRNMISLRPVANPSEVEGSIKRAFERRSEQDAKQVMVAVSGGQVTLSGETFSWAEREQAANAAWSTVGVTRVENHIKIAPTTWSGN